MYFCIVESNNYFKYIYIKMLYVISNLVEKILMETRIDLFYMNIYNVN